MRRLVASTVLLAACGHVSVPVPPYPTRRDYGKFNDDERAVYYCLNEVRGAPLAYEHGMLGKKYKAIEEMPLDQQPSTVRNAILYPVMIAGGIGIVATSIAAILKARDSSRYFQNDGSRAIPYGIVFGSSVIALLAGNKMRDRVGSQGEANDALARALAMPAGRRPNCAKIPEPAYEPMVNLYKKMEGLPIEVSPTRP